MILNDIPLQSVVDCSDTWTDDDLHEFSNTSWARINQHFEDEAGA